MGCLCLVKVINYEAERSLKYRRANVLQHWFYFIFLASKWIQGHFSLWSPSVVKSKLRNTLPIFYYFFFLNRVCHINATRSSCFNARFFFFFLFLMKQPFKCCLSFTFSAEWKMFLRDSVSSCPFWRLELKALDGPIERSPIERSPTNRWQKAFRVINVVQTT